jgi:hypothetical protein
MQLQSDQRECQKNSVHPKQTQNYASLEWEQFFLSEFSLNDLREPAGST